MFEPSNLLWSHRLTRMSDKNQKAKKNVLKKEDEDDIVKKEDDPKDVKDEKKEAEKETSESEKKEAGVVKDTKPTTSEKNSGIEVLFEVISRLRIVLDRTVNVSFGAKVIPLSSFMDKGVLPVTLIDQIDGDLAVWYDEINDQRYILTTCKDKITFTSIEEFVSAVISDFRRECKLSTSVLKEPDRLSVFQNSRCYNPEKMGFPFNEAIRLGVIDDQFRIVLSELLQGHVLVGGNPSFCSTHVFEYRRRGETRELFIAYALGNSERVVALYRDAVRRYNTALGLQDPDIKILSGFETLNPTYEFNAYQGVLDAMPKGSYV